MRSKNMENFKPVLIIEDDLEAVNFLNLAFKKHFSQVEFRYDAESALQYIQDHEPGLIICDILLPGLNGIEFTTKMRELGIQSPVIFLTASENIEYIRSAIRLNASDYLVKPMSLSQVDKKINEIIARFGKDFLVSKKAA